MVVHLISINNRNKQYGSVRIFVGKIVHVVLNVNREIDLLDWHNLLEVNVSLAKVLRVPNLAVGLWFT